MNFRRFITFFMAGLLALFATADLAVETISGQPLASPPFGVVSLVLACTLTLLAEGHRRFDQCERRLAQRDAARDVSVLGLRHGHVRAVNDDGD